MKRLVSMLTAALLLPSTVLASTDSFFGGYVTFSGVDSQIFKVRGSNFYSWEIGPRDTIVSEEFEIPSWTVAGSAELDSSVYKSGENSFKLSYNAYDGGYSGVSQSMKVNQARQYRIEFYVRAADAWGNIVTAGNTKRYLPTGTYGWRKVGFTTTASTGGYLTLDFRSYNQTGGVWIDDITVKEIGNEYSVINNGGFEQQFPETGFLVNEGTVNYVKSVFSHDEKKGINTMLLLSPHYMPQWFWDNYPNAYGYQEGFLKGDVIDDDYKLFIKTHVQAMADAVSGFSCLHSLVLTNEPIYNTSYYTPNKGQHFRDEFLAYLKEVYGEGTNGYVPSKLTQNWDWGNILPVKWDNFYASDFMSIDNNISSNGRYWDWMEFNNKILSDFHKFLADSVHEVDETIPVHTKLCVPVFSRSKLSYGTDFEDLNAYFDYSGFDGGMSYESDREGYLYIRMMEDLANSVSDHETVNSENHIVPDGCTDYSEKHALIAGADLFQGFIHNRTASSAWVWQTDQNDNVFKNSITYRPDVQENIAEKLARANELSAEIDKLQNADKNFYILYSKAALLYDEEAYMSACYNAYEALWSLGQRVSFVTEKQIADGKLPSDAVLVIPSTTNIDECTVSNLNAHTGKTIVIGTTPSKNEYNKSISVSLKNGVTVTDSLDVIRNAFASEIDNIITLKDADGNYIPMTDIRAVEEDEKILISACNNTWNTINNVSVYYGDKKLTDGVELVGFYPFRQTVTLSPFEPIIIEVNVN